MWSWKYRWWNQTLRCHPSSVNSRMPTGMNGKFGTCSACILTGIRIWSVFWCRATGKVIPLRKEYPARATEFEPFMLDEMRQDEAQEQLLFKPEEWGMKRGTSERRLHVPEPGPEPPVCTRCVPLSAAVRWWRSSIVYLILVTTIVARKKWANVNPGIATFLTPTGWNTLAA